MKSRVTLLDESRERLATVFPDTARYAATTLGEVGSSDGDEIIRGVAGQWGRRTAHAT